MVGMELQKYLVDKIQEVYRSQSVAINDKHIETICPQMQPLRAAFKRPPDIFLLSPVIPSLRSGQALRRGAGEWGRGRENGGRENGVGSSIRGPGTLRRTLRAGVSRQGENGVGSSIRGPGTLRRTLRAGVSRQVFRLSMAPPLVDTLFVPSPHMLRRASRRGSNLTAGHCPPFISETRVLGENGLALRRRGGVARR